MIQIKKIFIILLIIIISNPIYVFAIDKEEYPNITKGSTSSILIEASTNKILYSKDSNKISSVASLTKMMGLIIIFETIEKGGFTLNDIVTVSKNAKEMGGTQIWLEEGEKISVNDLIKGITMASANDAMVAMAELVSGTEESFVKLMNEKAKGLGLKNTYFKNSTGLDEEGHYSSAYDMSIIASELIKHEQILKFTSVYEDYIKESTNKTWISNTNKLVRFYEGADGLKTGFTDNAGSCLAVTSKRGDLRLIAITLGYSNTIDRNKEAMDLLDYGYNQYKATRLYKKGQVIDTIELKLADKSNIKLTINEDVLIISKKTEKEDKYTYDIEVLNNLKLPIKENEKLGDMNIKNSKGETIKSIPLITKEKIEKLGLFKFYLNSIKDVLLG